MVNNRDDKTTRKRQYNVENVVRVPQKKSIKRITFHFSKNKF